MRKFDVVVIGAGPAGMNAAIYAGRMGLNVGVIEGGLPGGQMNNTQEIENYIGYDSIGGNELSEKMESHMKDVISEDNLIYGLVDRITPGDESRFHIELDSEEFVMADTVIIATGCKHRKLGIPNEDINGISYCAFCDGPFFAGDDIAVIGGGNSAIEEALFLSDIANSVTIIHRRNEFRADSIYLEKAMAKDNIKFKLSYPPQEFLGEESLTGIRLKSTSGEVEDLDFDGAFVYVGLDPVVPEIVGLTDDWKDENGFLLGQKSPIPGIFAAGDVLSKDLRQVITAASDGALVAKLAYEFLN